MKKVNNNNTVQRGICSSGRRESAVLRVHATMVVPPLSWVPAHNPSNNMSRITLAVATLVIISVATPQVATAASSSSNGTVVALSRALDFYNTELLASNWNHLRTALSDECSNDVEQYVRALEVQENWALKMDDASGRYSTGWFWGNHYWTGSKSLCENIVPSNRSLSESNQNARVQRNVEAMTKLTNPGQSGGYVSGKLSYRSLPPFDVSFYMLRVFINSTYTKETRTLHVGLCLPKTCTDVDVRNILEKTSEAAPIEMIQIRVEEVRSPHSRFNLWQDTTFRILCVVTAIVVVLLVIGTLFDLYLKHREETKQVLKLNCATYTNPNHKLSEKTITLDMTATEPNAGKCSLYVVNNNNNNNLAANETRTGEDESLIVTILKDLILAFSVRVNVKHICDRSVGSDTISVIHGLKSISMAWVILGHTCLIAFKYSDNMEYRKVVQKEFLFQTISNGAFSVDTFFFTSGLLVSFLYFRTNAKGKLDTLGNKGVLAGFLHFFGLILYRFARLSAPYLFALGVVEVSMKWFNSNSIFEPPTMDHETCPKYWWRNILYINTLFPVEQMCMLWSWYLSDDTQFYVVGAILLILATSHFKIAASLVIIFMTSSWATTGYIAFSNSHLPSSDDPLALFDKIYDKPYTRLGPYLIGMGVGWILFKTNCRIKMSKLAVVVGWLVSAGCLLSLVYGLYEADLSPVAGAAYSSLSHSAWALGLAWVVVACSTGYGGYVNSILSATILYPFSRVTYCAYLLHPIVIRVMAMNMDSPLHLGKEVMVILFLGQVVASYALGFIVSVAFEAPVVSMLRILTRIAPKRKTALQT
ncbi:PREDICTED: uncharacterized protein LOC108561633 [Nicrophorus vespilloides]|uniref:Uncharacterized protein LOC108561633 n=1 Tax=Nicrophorus vespilloides TaxID=110193 RepID=A0ABM1MKQ0_NICVS|nr:PREDICTED: uncharacterized protein LOC108561633 [Nicrophorus vespilloides]